VANQIEMRLSTKTFWVLLTCFSYCFSSQVKGQKVIPIDTSNVQILRIDPSNATGGNASEIFKSIKYIPLQTTKESLFGKIGQLEITDQYFIILDQSTNSILFFNKDGTYHHKIKGGNPDFGAQSFDKLNLIRETNELVFLENNKGLTYVFLDFTGKKTREINYDFNTKLQFMDYKFLSKDELISSNPYDPEIIDGKQTKFLLEYVKSFHDVYASAFPFKPSLYKNRYDSYMFNNFTYTGTDTAFFYVKPNEYNIFKVSKNCIAHTYKLVLPLQYALPESLIADSTISSEIKQETIRNKGYVSRIGEFYQLGDNLAFHLYSYRNQGLEDDLIYNLKTGNLIAYNHLLTDESTYFLPITENKLDKSGFLNAKSNHAYLQFSSLEMFNSHKENKDKNIKYSPALERYFVTESYYSNPVLLQVSFK